MSNPKVVDKANHDRGRVKTGKGSIKSREIRAKAFELRKMGLSLEAVGQQLGVSRQRVHKLISKSLAELDALNTQSLTELRDLDLARLDDALLQMMVQMKRGNQGAVDRVIRILERRAKLIGLDAPTRTEMSGPGGEPLEFVDKTEEVRAKLFRNGVEVLPVLKDEK